MSSLNISLDINNRIANVRKVNSLRQKEFSQKLQISQGYLSEVENGKKKPSIEMLIGIYNLFGDKINMDWLFTGKGQMFKEDTTPEWLNDWWQQADDEHRTWLKIQLSQTPPTNKNKINKTTPKKP